MADDRFDRPVRTHGDTDTEINMNPDEIQTEIQTIEEQIKSLQERRALLARSLGQTGTDSAMPKPTPQTKPSSLPRRRGTW